MARATGVLAAIAALLLIQTAAAQQLNATQAQAVTLASLMPPKIAVNLKFMIDGQSTTETACVNDALNAACLPKVKATQDKVFITYNLLSGVTPNLTDKIMLKACYSNFSQTDRPWRATNPIIAKSKKCPITIAKGLNPEESNSTGIAWKPGNLVATATYFVRAYVVHNSSSTVSYPVATGASKGYFQVDAIDSRPKGMKIAAGICGSVGPLLFLGYFGFNFLRNKKNP